MHLCLTVECITSGLHWSGFLIRSHPPLQGAQPMPSCCPPDAKCQPQWRLYPTVTAPNRFGNFLQPPVQPLLGLPLGSLPFQCNPPPPPPTPPQGIWRTLGGGLFHGMKAGWGDRASAIVCFGTRDLPRDRSSDRPTAVACPPTAVGCPPSAVGCPPTAVGCPPTAVGCPPTAVGCPPSAVGCPPTAVGCPPSAVGCPPTAVGCPPTVELGLTAASGCFCFAVFVSPRDRPGGRGPRRFSGVLLCSPMPVPRPPPPPPPGGSLRN